MPEEKKYSPVSNSIDLINRTMPIPVVCAGAEMVRIFEVLKRVSSDDSPILITGETGVGKELIAQSVHKLSNRADKHFAVINCSSLSRETLESQLFGHRRGAFTGATCDFPGILKHANGGTLFLDEIGDMDLSIQPKLLRFLQSGEILPLGDVRPSIVNVRLIAATNRDLKTEIDIGHFRSDLFYRINTISITVPPLRHRRDEIPHLIMHYLNHYAQQSKKGEINIMQEALNVLVNYDWPGNIRQLSNELRRVVVFAENNGLITVNDLSSEIVSSQGGLHMGSTLRASIDTMVDDLHLSLSQGIDLFEKEFIAKVMQMNAGRITQTARALGLTRRGFKLKLRRLNLQSEDTSEIEEDDNPREDDRDDE